MQFNFCYSDHSSKYSNIKALRYLSTSYKFKFDGKKQWHVHPWVHIAFQRFLAYIRAGQMMIHTKSIYSV